MRCGVSETSFEILSRRAFQRAMLDQRPSTFGQMRPQIRHDFHPILEKNVRSAIWTLYHSLGLVNATELVKVLF